MKVLFLQMGHLHVSFQAPLCDSILAIQPGEGNWMARLLFAVLMAFYLIMMCYT